MMNSLMGETQCSIEVTDCGGEDMSLEILQFPKAQHSSTHVWLSRFYMLLNNPVTNLTLGTGLGLVWEGCLENAMSLVLPSLLLPDGRPGIILVT